MPEDDTTHPPEDWQNPETYAWTLELPRRGFAWELLRRNTHYREAWLHVAEQQRFTRHPSGAQIVTMDRPLNSSLKWSLLGPLENPAQDARVCRVFWSPRECSDTLAVTATPAATSDTAFPSAQTLHCKMAVFNESTGTQHVLFTEAGQVLQLQVSGASILDRVKLAAEVIQAGGTAAHRFRAIERLRDLQAHRSLRPHLYAPAKGAIRFVEILQTLDGLSQSATHKDIAAALFGMQRVSQEWAGQNRHMRDKVRKTIKRATQLVNGEYRTLLS